MELIHQQQNHRECHRPIYLICVFRDEHLLLEYFVEYYRSLGVTHFIMIDNLSEDEGPAYLKSLKNINLSLYRTEDSYRDAAYGTKWVNHMLEQYCADQYCFTVDVDELFLFDSRKYQDLHDLIDDMESSGKNAVPVTLLDMYPEKLNDSYVRGVEFHSHSPFFDDFNEVHYEDRGRLYKTFNFWVGGVRKRALGVEACINKFPLFKYNFYPLEMSPGCHFFQKDGQVVLQSEAIKLHSDPGVLLHFKFIKPRFQEFVEQRIARNEDWGNSAEYKSYLQALQTNSTLELYDQKYSTKFLDTNNLKNFFGPI